MINVVPFYCNPLRECTYLMSNTQGEALLIDCGASTQREWDRIANYVQDNGWTVVAQLLTHAHLDHTVGCRFAYSEYGVIPFLYQKDLSLFEMQEQQARDFGFVIGHELLLKCQTFSTAQLKFGSFCVDVILTPGHSAGSVCYYFKSDNILFSGDTLFQQGIGRDDLYTGNHFELIQSLSVLSELPDDTIVCPGHGLPTTIEKEKHFGYLR